MIGEQETPRLAVVHRDTDVPLVEDDAVALVGRLHPAILEPVGHYQDDPFRLVTHKLTLQVQQPAQDGLPLQVGQFDLVEFFQPRPFLAPGLTVPLHHTPFRLLLFIDGQLGVETIPHHLFHHLPGRLVLHLDRDRVLFEISFTHSFQRLPS